MYNNRRRVLPSLYGLIIFLLLFLNSCANKDASVPGTLKTTLQPQAENYNTATVTKGDFVSTFSSKNTQLIFQSEISVKSDKKPSKLRELSVKKFDFVSEGDVIATLDMELSMVNIEEKQLSLERSKLKYQADIQEKEENLKLQEQTLNQLPEGKEKEIAILRLQKSRSQQEQFILQTERGLKQQEEAITEAIETYQNNTIVAPFDGMIIDLPKLEIGDKINTGDTICRMASGENILLGVMEQGLLRYDMKVTVTTRHIKDETVYPGRVVASKDVVPEDLWQDITYIALDDPTKYFELNNPVVNTDYITIKDVLLVDPTSISNDADKRFVSLYEEDQISKKYVVIGKSSKEKVWVLQGLTENQTVINYK